MPERPTLVGDGLEVPCVDGRSRRYVNLDAAASTSALPGVFERVVDFVPWYSSVHRGAGYKSQLSTALYEDAHAAIRAFAGRTRRRRRRDHLPQHDRGDQPPRVPAAARARGRRRHDRRRAPREPAALGARRARAASSSASATARSGPTPCARRSTPRPRPRLLAITGASNVTGWMPPLDEIIAAAHERGVPVLVDAAQLAPHRPLPARRRLRRVQRPQDVRAVRHRRADRPARRVRGGRPVPRRRRRGRPASTSTRWCGAAARARGGRLAQRRRRRRARRRRRRAAAIGWERDRARTTRRSPRALRDGPARRSRASASSGPARTSRRCRSRPSTSRASRTRSWRPALSAEFAIGVRHGCFCAHPYLVRLLGLDAARAARASATPRSAASGCAAARRGARLGRHLDDARRRRAPARGGRGDRVGRRRRRCATSPTRDTGDYWPEGLPVPGEPGGLRSPGVAFSGFRDRREGRASRSPAARGGSR